MVNRINTVAMAPSGLQHRVVAARLVMNTGDHRCGRGERHADHEVFGGGQQHDFLQAGQTQHVPQRGAQRLGPVPGCGSAMAAANPLMRCHSTKAASASRNSAPVAATTHSQRH